MWSRLAEQRSLHLLAMCCFCEVMVTQVQIFVMLHCCLCSGFDRTYRKCNTDLKACSDEALGSRGLRSAHAQRNIWVCQPQHVGQYWANAISLALRSCLLWFVYSCAPWWSVSWSFGSHAHMAGMCLWCMMFLTMGSGDIVLKQPVTFINFNWFYIEMY